MGYYLEEKKRTCWRVVLAVNKWKTSLGMNKKTVVINYYYNNKAKRNAITATLFARSKKWKRMYCTIICY